MERDSIGGLPLRARGLAALRGVLDSPTSRDFLALLELLASERIDPVALAETFGRLWAGLFYVERDPLLPDAWQSHLVGRLLDEENPFALGAERGKTSPALVEQARRDLRTLRELFELEAKPLVGMVEDAVPGLGGVWVPWRVAGPGAEPSSPRHAVALKLAATEDWGDCVGLLADHFTRHGAGRFGRHRAFRWRGNCLQAVPEPDPVRLAGLIGYEREREPLLRNTERFLAGLPAHHALLYGLPGTGKSSTVKAILNEYADRGLRLVEVAKGHLGSLPQVLEIVRGRGPRFVVFVDDLSFEEHEVEYKSLKALLEGSVEEPPENVRVYATSNRRNLVRERFSEREDDVHARDSSEEKLSLAARFGLRVAFPAPDRQRYLGIVTGLASQRGINIAEGDLIERAILWDRWHAGRSGRTARQFVDELEAEVADGMSRSS